MWKGSVVSLHITPAVGEPMQPLEDAHAVPGRGLEGDRYYLGTGYFSANHGPDYELSLIELETIESLNEEHPNLHLAAGDARRNVVTQSVPLNHLVHKTFRVGEVVLRGMRLCEPCLHIAELTHHNVLSGLIHRGGLRAQILTEGIIRVGDTIELCDFHEETRSSQTILSEVK